MSSRTARVIQRNPVLRRKKKRVLPTLRQGEGDGLERIQKWNHPYLSAVGQDETMKLGRKNYFLACIHCTPGMHLETHLLD